MALNGTFVGKQCCILETLLMAGLFWHLVLNSKGRPDVNVDDRRRRDDVDYQVNIDDQRKDVDDRHRRRRRQSTQ